MKRGRSRKYKPKKNLGVGGGGQGLKKREKGGLGSKGNPIKGGDNAV